MNLFLAPIYLTACLLRGVDQEENAVEGKSKQLARQKMFNLGGKVDADYPETVYGMAVHGKLGTWAFDSGSPDISAFP